MGKMKELAMNGQEVLELQAGDIWDKSRLTTLLIMNDKAVVRALDLIYSKQTEAEKNADRTTESNGQGFTAFDAEFLSSCAKFYRRTGFLTSNQINKVRPKIKKYWKQILEDMKTRGYEVSMK